MTPRAHALAGEDERTGCWVPRPGDLAFMTRRVCTFSQPGATDGYLELPTAFEMEEHDAVIVVSVVDQTVERRDKKVFVLHARGMGWTWSSLLRATP